MPPVSAGDVVFQTMPRCVTVAPPLAVTLPPRVAVFWAMSAATSAVTVGMVEPPVMGRVAVDCGNGILSVKFVLVTLSTVREIVSPAADALRVT